MLQRTIKVYAGAIQINRSDAMGTDGAATASCVCVPVQPDNTVLPAPVEWGQFYSFGAAVRVDYGDTPHEVRQRIADRVRGFFAQNDLTDSPVQVFFLDSSSSY